MSVSGGIVVFAMYWFLGLFWMLPLGIRTQEEEGGVVAGTPPGAPVRHGLKWKVGGATAVALALWTITWVVVRFDLVPVDTRFD